MAVPKYKRSVRCIETGEVFSSIGAAAKAKNISHSNLCMTLKYNIPRVHGGFHFEYAEGTPTFKPKIKCVENGNLYESQIDAAKDIGVSRQAVSLAMKLGSKVKGYTFVYIEEKDARH